MTLDPATPVTTLRGPETAVAGLVRSFVLQLASYPAAGRTRILIQGPTPPLLAARFLPGALLTAEASATSRILAVSPGAGFERGVLIIATGAGATGICAAAVSRGWQVLCCTSDPAAPPAAGTALVLGERTARLSSVRSPTLEFIPDLVPSRVFDRSCRRLATVAPALSPPAGLPDVCSLSGLLPVSAADISARWEASAAGPGLPVVVGVGRSGPLLLDLQADGPHILVAGTTGSGKSELLRTLAAGLAAAHPPDRVNLLFVDFKGGSALQPLVSLVHCVGLLTDLALEEVARALASLRAEVRRREELLAAHQAADLPSYEALSPAGRSLPHLVLIIDEFRILLDEAPQALAELMRIAAIGRALGVHLIMATQRPQGAVSADIRANVTSCIALRVQSELESLDVINSSLAAAIPVSTPGRAFLVRGNGAPEEFQTAAVTPTVLGPGHTTAVLEAAEYLASPCGRPV
ncbi:FtsK/SpoIIIE domain-containing protein [Pseudarthrobacter sp. So.54]